MPPKVKILRKDIVSAAVDIARREGAQAVNARSIAAALNCSTQPVFSNFATMEELRGALIDAADTLCLEYMEREVKRGEYPPYKATGIAYIRFAKEERELFKLLYMRDRSAENAPEENDLSRWMASLVHDNTGLEGDDTKLFHLEMWAYVHGIAAMIATDYYDPEWSLVSRMLTDAYQGLKKQFGKE